MQINTKDNIWLVTARSKNAVDAWFKDLTNETKTLAQLSRKVPIFNKKEEIFTQLFEFQVPMFKASWFIKMSCAYQVALSEANNKSKKRQMPDPSQEWTNALCRFLREHYQKLFEQYQGSLSIMSPFSSTSPSEQTGAQKQWHYYTQLARYLFEEGLLDRHDFLTWLLDLFEKIKSPDDWVMGVVISLLLQYVEDFTQSEVLSRKLASHCARKLSQLLSDCTNGVNGEVQSVENNQSNGVNPANGTQNASNLLIANFTELLSCNHHRNVVLGLSAIIQIITLECSTSLVWHNIGENKSGTSLHGSPLDFLPCAPSNLPMPQRSCNAYLRNELKKSEEQIRMRSIAAEIQWSVDRWQQISSGSTINQLLTVLDALDRHCFDRVDSTNSLDILYGKIFPLANVASNNDTISGNEVEAKNVTEAINSDEPIIKLLCEWSVTPKRSGEHRALVVAKLLEKRLSEITTDKEGDIPEKDSENSFNSNNVTAKNSVPNSSIQPGTPIFQNLLLNFLDTQAPVYEEKTANSNFESKQAFSNLILLFGELIRCDVFSHDLYMCTLISRGQFANSPVGSLLSQTSVPKSSVHEETSLAGFVPNLSGASDLAPHMSGLDGTNVQRSTSQSSLPMFDPVSNHPNQSQQSDLRWDAPSMDAIDDAHLDADLDKLLQHIKAGKNMSDQTGLFKFQIFIFTNTNSYSLIACLNLDLTIYSMR